MGAFIGIFLHAIGGFAAGSFYIPMNFVKNWTWETAWTVLGFAAWLLAPWLMAFMTTPHLLEILSSADSSTLLYTFLFGMAWGVGGLTFGMSMRYLGLSLGMAVALGFTAAFGTLVPPIVDKTIWDKFTTSGGQLTMAGIFLVLVGIAFIGKAGMAKEKDLGAENQQDVIKEFNLMKGLAVAIFSGILSASFSFGLTSGGPIAQLSAEAGTHSLFVNNAVLVVILLGGILSNYAWTMYMTAKKGSFSEFSSSTKIEGGKRLEVPLTKNYIFAALGGITWYLQFFFYGMGATYLSEKFGFASWSLHMGFIILFSTMWGIYFKEWKGISASTKNILILGIVILLSAFMMIGYGNYLEGA
ncbi:MAG TPA: rhamnose/proton symporter RhaT [Saprospiraceae bacterium]|nr:rhamnose/proton symporter RhaT [Saprospiraceae bacterium]